MTNKIELVDILPTKKEIVNYGKYIYSLKVETDGEHSYEAPYTISDEELTMQKLNEYHKCCKEYDIDGDSLLASLITAKCLENVSIDNGSGDD